MPEQNSKPVKGPGRRGPVGPKPKIKNPGKLFARLMKYILGNYAPHCIVVLVCIIATVLSSVQGTMFMQTLIDDYIEPMINRQNPDFGPLAARMLRVAAFYAVGVLTAYIQSRVMVNVSQGTLLRLREEMFRKMESLPIKYFDTHSHGDIMSMYTNDIDTLRQMISQSIPQFINSFITVVSVLACMVVLSVPLTVLTLFMVGVVMFLTKKLAGLSGSYFVAQQKDIGELNGYIEEMISGQKVVKVFCHEEESKADFASKNESLYESAYQANQFANMLGPINAQVGNISYVFCAIAGGLLALHGTFGFTIGKLVSFLNFNRSFNMPISQISQQLNAVVMALAGAERIFALIDEQPETDDGYVELVNARENGDGSLSECEERTGIWAWKHYHREKNMTTYQRLEGEVVFDHVDFGYNDDKIILHDIEMYAKPGQKIAFVGATGAGKTTITNLINRFYDIQDGKIRYDGINVNKIKKKDLRLSLGVVLQETHLFTGTVEENIRYGKLDASHEDVVNAAKLANAHSFIKRLPDGYDTMLTGDGASLSQGQRQLLAIARAAIADPPALILDEATSSIDTRTEKLVQQGMDRLMSGRTTFVIAHRLSTVRNSDCIMVLEDGRIIERGTHDELIERQGKYYQLYTGKTANDLV